MHRVAIIDDGFHVFASSEPVQRLRQAAEVVICEEPFPSEEALVRALQGVHAVIANRERTAVPRSLLEQLPDLCVARIVT
jgi:D-3-phosphoglycerate dehydrogenase